MILSREKLAELIRDLVDFGEDNGELTMWYSLYDALHDREKEQLCLNLQKELEDLRKLT